MNFPTNVSAVTVWEKVTVNRAPTYIRHELEACYWEDTRGQTDSRTPADSIFLAIPGAGVTYLPKKDDRVLSGSIPDETPPREALTVMQVKDYRYLLPGLYHVEVTLE